MSKTEEIRNRLANGYTLSIYGTREVLYKQMEEDISTLLNLLINKNKEVVIIIENIETDLNILNHYPSYTGELGNLKQNSVINLSDIIKLSNKIKDIRKNI